MQKRQTASASFFRSGVPLYRFAKIKAFPLALFVIGAVAGIVSFSHLLSWLLRRHHDPTIALLMGFMICLLYTSRCV